MHEKIDVKARSPIVVDIDGVLLRSCSADEVFLEQLRGLSWPSLRRSKEHDAGAESDLRGSVAQWPENEDLIHYLRNEAATGREIVLATSAERNVAAAVVARYPFIGRIVQLPEGLSGADKASRLRDLYPDGFSYAGRTQDDVAIWQAADDAIAVNASGAVLRQLGDAKAPSHVFVQHGFNIHTLRKTLRLHQWAKNFLIFVPLVLGGKMLDAEAWLHAVLGFLALGLIASATYIVNDLIDLPNDRQHPTKRYRPLASGEIAPRTAMAIMAACLATGFGIAIFLGGHALGMLCLYLVITLSYSLWLKRTAILDVTLLSTLYTLRLGLGIVLANVSVSYWLLIFSMFVFLSLSLAKRYTELMHAKDKEGEVLGRGYAFADAPLVLNIGVSSAMAAVLIMTLFLSEEVFTRPQYIEPHLLWACPPILFLFLGRVWLLAQRGQMHDDPVAFALKDKTSVLLGGVMTLTIILALIGPRIW